jgi:hypothetical protein
MQNLTLGAVVAVLALLLGNACAGGADGTCVDTCDAVYPRFDDDVEALRQGRIACTENAECEAVVPTTGCEQKATWLSVCHVAVRGDEAQAFLDDVTALSEIYCAECMPECHQGPDCPSTFAPICDDGKCAIAITNPGD